MNCGIGLRNAPVFQKYERYSERKECLKVEFLLSSKGFCVRTRINKWSMLAQSCFFVGTDGRLLGPDKRELPFSRSIAPFR